jgi:hypothetical protein
MQQTHILITLHILWIDCMPTIKLNSVRDAEVIPTGKTHTKQAAGW